MVEIASNREYLSAVDSREPVRRSISEKEQTSEEAIEKTAVRRSISVTEIIMDKCSEKMEHKQLTASTAASCIQGKENTLKIKPVFATKSNVNKVIKISEIRRSLSETWSNNTQGRKREEVRRTISATEPSSNKRIEMIKDVNSINERHRKPNHEKKSMESGKSPTRIFIEKFP